MALCRRDCRLETAALGNGNGAKLTRGRRREQRRRQRRRARVSLAHWGSRELPVPPFPPSLLLHHSSPNLFSVSCNHSIPTTTTINRGRSVWSACKKPSWRRPQMFLLVLLPPPSFLPSSCTPMDGWMAYERERERSGDAASLGRREIRAHGLKGGRRQGQKPT